MTLPTQITTLEQQKFEEYNGNVTVRTSAVPVGVSAGGVVTEVTLNSSTWVALPSSPATTRKAIAIQNISTIQIKINYSSSVSGYVGMIVYPNGGERRYQAASGVVLYGKSESGNPVINVEEIG